MNLKVLNDVRAIPLTPIVALGSQSGRYPSRQTIDISLGYHRVPCRDDLWNSTRSSDDYWQARRHCLNRREPELLCPEPTCPRSDAEHPGLLHEFSHLSARELTPVLDELMFGSFALDLPAQRPIADDHKTGVAPQASCPLARFDDIAHALVLVTPWGSKFAHEHHDGFRRSPSVRGLPQVGVDPWSDDHRAIGRAAVENG